MCFQDTVCTYYKHGSMSPFYWSFFAFSNVLWCLWFNLVQQFLPTYGLKTWMIVGQWSDSLMRPILTRDVQVGMEGAPVKSPVFGHFLVWSQWSTAGFHQGSDSRHPTNPRTFPSLSSIIRAFCFSDPIQTKQQHMINATTWNYWLFSVSSSFGRNWYLGCPCGGTKLGKASECGTRNGPTALIRPVAC